MRKLVFGTEEVDRDRFDILYGGACVSPRGLGRAELPTFSSLLEKFQQIAKPIIGVGENAVCKFELGDAGGEVTLEEEEFRLLNELHDQIRWMGSKSPVIASTTYDWLVTLDKIKLRALRDDG